MSKSDISLAIEQEPLDDRYFYMISFFRRSSATLRHVLNALATSPPPPDVLEALEELYEASVALTLVIGDPDSPEGEKVDFDEETVSVELSRVAVAEVSVLVELARWRSEWLGQPLRPGVNGSGPRCSLAHFLFVLGEEFTELVGSSACEQMPRVEREKIIELQRGYSEVARSIELDEAGRREHHPRRLMMDAKVLAELSATEWGAFAVLNAWRIGWFNLWQHSQQLAPGCEQPSGADTDSA